MQRVIGLSKVPDIAGTVASMTESDPGVQSERASNNNRIVGHQSSSHNQPSTLQPSTNLGELCFVFSEAFVSETTFRDGEQPYLGHLSCGGPRRAPLPPPPLNALAPRGDGMRVGFLRCSPLSP